jgi:hypothetical protein
MGQSIDAMLRYGFGFHVALPVIFA